MSPVVDIELSWTVDPTLRTCVARCPCQSLSAHSAGRCIRAADGAARHQEEQITAKTSASVKGGVRHHAVMAARSDLCCAVRGWLVGKTSGVLLREVLVDRAEWRCVWRLGFLARILWCIVGCSGDSLLVYCEFSRRCSWSLSSYLLFNSSSLCLSLALYVFCTISRLYDSVMAQFLEPTSYDVVSIWW